MSKPLTDREFELEARLRSAESVLGVANDSLDAADARIQKLEAQLAEARAVLREHAFCKEWDQCIECGGYEPDHTPDCRLVAALAPREG